MLVEYYVSFVSFPLVLELVLQPVAILAVTLAAYTAGRPGYESVLRLCNWSLVLLGIGGFGWVLWNLVSRWEEVDGSQVLAEMFLPIWLTPAALAFVYALALYSGYERAFVRIDRKAERPAWKIKLAYISLVGVRVSRLRAVDGGVQIVGASQPDLRGAKAAMLAELDRRRQMLELNTEPAPPDIDQISWSIATDRGLVTLKGDLPEGYPTETWIDDFLVDRDLEGNFSWNLRAGLPAPVALLEEIEDRNRVLDDVVFWEMGASLLPMREASFDSLLMPVRRNCAPFSWSEHHKQC